MKKRRILSVLLVAIMLLTNIGALGVGAFAADGSLDGYAVEVTLINGAKVGTDDLDEAFEMLYYFDGGKIKLNEDVVFDRSATLYDKIDIDLNGHTLSGGNIYADIDSIVSVTDSSANGGGELSNVYLSVLNGKLSVKGVKYDGKLALRENGNATVEDVDGTDLTVYYGGEDSSVTFKDTEIDCLTVDYDTETVFLMEGLTVREQIFIHYTSLEEFFDLACVSVTDGDGQAVSFEPDAASYSGVLRISHDASRIDKTVWEKSSLGHWHECVCGYKADFAEHTVEGETCTVCNDTPYMSVTAEGTTVGFFDFVEALEYASEKGEATVKLLKDVKCTDSADVYGEGTVVTFDLNGFTANGSYMDLYDDARFNVKDSSLEKNGLLLLSSYIDLNDSSVLTVDEGGIDAPIYAYGDSRAYLNGGSSSIRYSYIEGESEFIVNGGEYRELDVSVYDNGKFFIVNAKITENLSFDTDCLGDILDHPCFSIDVGGGDAIDYTDYAYYCDGNVLTVTHSDALTSSDVKGSDGRHGKLCSGCGYVFDGADCSGGEATCSVKAVCSTCGEGYGETLPHTIGESDKCTVCQADAYLKVEGDGKTLYFFNLGEAFKAADELSSATVTLLNDVSFGDDELDVEGNITLDINGYELFTDEFNIYGKMVIKDSAGEGTFLTDSSIDIYENGHLVIESGSFDMNEYFNIDLEEDGAHLEIKGGVFGEIELEVYADDSLSVLSGGYFYDLGIYNEEDGKVIINGGEYGCEPYISYDEKLKLSDILSADCITVYDENDDAIDVSDLENDYYENIRVEHNDSCEGESYIAFGNGHVSACLCGAPKNHEIHAHNGGTATCDKRAECADCGAGYGDKLPHTFENGVCTVCGNSELVKVEAEGFSQIFDSIEDALEAAKKHERATVTLLNNVVSLGYCQYEAENELVIDLAGYTIAAIEHGVLSADVTIKDSSESKSGAILGYSIVFDKGASVTLNGGNFYLHMYTYEAALTVNGGVFKDKLIGIVYGEEATVQISGGVFEKGLELYSGDGTGTLTFTDVMKNCNVLKDENGNPINMTEQRYEGYISVVDTCHFELASNKDGHWYECSECGLKKETVEHIDEDKDKKCDHCAFDLSVKADKDGGGLGVGAIVGISVGGVIVLGVGGFALFWFVIKKKSFADLVAVFKK